MSSFSALKTKKEKAKSYVTVSSFPRDSSSAAHSPAKTPELGSDAHGNGIQEESRKQVQNDGLYSLLPSWLEIRVSDVQGRGLWAIQPIRSGSTILSVKPHSHAISNRYLDTCCSACSASAEAQTPTKLSRCTKCRVVWYCDAACQTSDWSIHKHECAALQRWFQVASAAGPSSEESSSSEDAFEYVVRPPSDAIRCMARMLWKKQKKGFDSVWAKEIDNMQSHRITLSKGDTNTKNIENQTQLPHSLVQYLGVTSPQDLSSQFGIERAGALVDFISKECGGPSIFKF